MIHSKKIIPILMSADHKYMRYLWVAISSMLANKNIDTSYLVYILTPKPYPNKVLKHFDILQQSYSGVEFEFVLMGDLFNDQVCSSSILPSPTFYYLKIADIISNYDKAIYLDPDIIVCKDLTRLFELDLKDNYVAGVKAAGYIADENYGKFIGGLPMDQYINANSLVFNLKKIREDGLTRKFIALAQRKYPSMDQDVLNIACYDKILHIPFAFNLMTKYLPINGNGRYSKESLIDVYGENDLIDADNDPVVIHYADVGRKPWHMHTEKDYYWWRYALTSPWRVRFVLEYILHQCIQCMKSCCSVNKKTINGQKCKKYNILGIRFTKYKKLYKEERE